MISKRQLTILQQPVVAPFYSATPKDVSLSITGRCQLRCHHCFNRSGPDNSHELPLATIERFLDEVVSWGVHFLRLSGGEPTYHRQFRDVIEACRQRQIRIAMNSHGVYPGAMLTYLLSVPIELFLISVDGMEINNDAIRGRGTFKRAIHSCQQLRSAGQRVMIACHIGTNNRGDIGELTALANEIGVDIKFSPIRPIGRAREELPNALIRPEDYLRVVQEAAQLRHLYPNIRINTDFDILNGPPDSDCRPDPKSASCKAGRTMIHINYDGTIIPCAFFATPEGEFSAGNIYQESVTHVWQEAPTFQPFRVHQKSRTCQRCGYYQKQCAGGCPAIAHFTTGSLDAHDPTCFIDLIESPEGASR